MQAASSKRNLYSAFKLPLAPGSTSAMEVPTGESPPATFEKDSLKHSFSDLLRRIQVKDIIKEVNDYLKTYSSAEMDIN
ncbi:hypothetical protein Tco_0452791 [Tanacetum coccineum]